MGTQIVGGIKPHHYHTLPDQLNSLKASPLKENIFIMLSNISDEEFPEFVTDILLQVEGHTLVDITDGPGDEKQDILTYNKAGIRCLTQCKHTINYKKNYNGDELDRMVVACMRKSCKKAIFVTNSDLTPPAKRYVTDKEYERGQDPNNIITVDYWNDVRLWEKIKNHPSILNKWFSGLSQTNALRSFRFDASLKQLPEGNTAADETDVSDLLKIMIDQKLLILHDDKSITGKIDGHDISVTRSVEIDANMNVNYRNIHSEKSLRHQGLLTLQIMVMVDPAIDVYRPSEIKERIIQQLFEPVLPKLPNGSWWHIPTGRSSAFTYLFDINEPRVITLDNGSSYVGVDQKVQDEIAYCSLKEPDFKAVRDESEDVKEDDAIFSYQDSGIEVIQWFENELDPVTTYNYQVMQLNQLEELKNFQFMAVEKVDKNLLMRIRRILPQDYTAFQYNEDTLMWAIPTDADPDEIERTYNKLRAIRLTPLVVRDEHRDEFLANIQKDLPPATTMFVSTVENLSKPVKLNERVFWLKKNLQLQEKVDLDLATELLTFKYGYDNDKGGFDNLMGAETLQTHSVELRELLWDIFTFRGKRMLDIAIYRNPITISIRYSDNEIGNSEELTKRYISEFEVTFQEIEELIQKHIEEKNQSSRS